MYKVNFDTAIEMNIEPNTSAADSLKELMQFHKITQAEFAEHVGISQKQLSFILNRKAFMSVQVADQIAKATGMSAKWLLQLDLNYKIEHHTQTDYSMVVPFEWAPI